MILLKLNCEAVKRYKEEHQVEKKFTPGQLKDIIRVDLEAATMNLEEDVNGIFVEDMEDDPNDVPDDVTMHEVEDLIVEDI